MPMGGIDDVFLIGADQAYHRGRPGEIARRIRESGRHPSELVFLLDRLTGSREDHISCTGAPGAAPIVDSRPISAITFWMR